MCRLYPYSSTETLRWRGARVRNSIGKPSGRARRLSCIQRTPAWHTQPHHDAPPPAAHRWPPIEANVMPTTCHGVNAHRTRPRSPHHSVQRSGVQSSSVSQSADAAEPPPPRQTTSRQSQKAVRSQTSPMGRRSAPHAMQRSRRQSGAEELRELSRLQRSSARSKQRAAATEHRNTGHPPVHAAATETNTDRRRARSSSCSCSHAHRHAHAETHGDADEHRAGESDRGEGESRSRRPRPPERERCSFHPTDSKSLTPPCRR